MPDPKAFELQIRAMPPAKHEVIRPVRQERCKANASNSTRGSSHRGGCPAVAGESVHSDAGFHQINSERCRGYRGRVVAAERFWAISLAFARSHWILEQASHSSEIKTDTKQNGRPSATRRQCEENPFVRRCNRAEC